MKATITIETMEGGKVDIKAECSPPPGFPGFAHELMAYAIHRAALNAAMEKASETPSVKITLEMPK